jgi:membrane-associated protein
VFAESRLLVGFFLPGDTLLFVAGFLSSAAGGHVLPPIPVTAGIAFAALGDSTTSTRTIARAAVTGARRSDVTNLHQGMRRAPAARHG